MFDSILDNRCPQSSSIALSSSLDGTVLSGLQSTAIKWLIRDMIIIAGVALVSKQGESSITDIKPSSTCRFKCHEYNMSQPYQRLPKSHPHPWSNSSFSSQNKLIWGLVVKSFTRRISHSHHHQHWNNENHSIGGIIR